jgi:hypothetical protein
MRRQFRRPWPCSYDYESQCAIVNQCWISIGGFESLHHVVTKFYSIK